MNKSASDSKTRPKRRRTLPAGYVYVLRSSNCDLIKIGGSDYPPGKRIKEINTAEPYRSLGPWELKDFRQVKNWRKIESELHFIFRDHRDYEIESQRELFRIDPLKASEELHNKSLRYSTRINETRRLFQHEQFYEFIIMLFKYTGLRNFLDLQGSWTFRLFPQTSRGRFYTINIGNHEVAFASMARPGEPSIHMIYMDQMIRDFREPMTWLKRRKGVLQDQRYTTALYHSTSVLFAGDFEDAIEFLSLKGVRRSIMAYWMDSLIELQTKNRQSLFGRHHDWNAVAELNRRLSLPA